MAATTRLACLLCLLLTACGQAGALYLPGEQAPQHGTTLRPDAHKPSEDPFAQRGKKPDTTVGKPAQAPAETPAEPDDSPAAPDPSTAPATAPATTPANPSATPATP